MSRAIEIIDTSGFYWAVSIDGNVIHLGKRLCRVDFGIVYRFLTVRNRNV